MCTTDRTMQCLLLHVKTLVAKIEICSSFRLRFQIWGVRCGEIFIGGHRFDSNSQGFRDIRGIMKVTLIWPNSETKGSSTFPEFDIREQDSNVHIFKTSI